MVLTSVETIQQTLSDVLRKAHVCGADQADVIYVEGKSVSVSVRERKLETLEHSEGGDIGLRVFVGQRQAVVSTTDTNEDTLDLLVERAVSMARLAPEDPFCGLAAPECIAKTFPSLDISDEYLPDVDVYLARAKEAEDAVLSVEGISQCESADAGGGFTQVVLAATNGFSGHYRRTSYYVSASALAGSETLMERDHDYDSVVYQADLASPKTIGMNAAHRVIKSLNPRKVETCRVPVVFDPREARGILGAFIGAINAARVARGTSFLKDMLGKEVFPRNVTIVDDPHRSRGHRSRLFDAEGLPTKKLSLVENGVLTSWLSDLRSARQLGITSTGHASRSVAGVPSPSCTNAHILPGHSTPQELISDIKNGFYVTETMGHGVNGVTGDYSLAARGFWIEEGEISFPVSEMTIAGNLKDMFANMSVANDLSYKYGVDAPTMRVEGMTVAGT